MKTVLETSGTTLKHQHLYARGPRRRREKGPEKIFEEVIAENLPNIGKEAVTQVQEVQSPKEEHAETHSNQVDKN